jgi:hypothetical protein
MEYYLQDSSNDEYRVPHALLEAALVALESATKTTGQTISVPAGGYIQKVFVKSSAASTIKIESSSGLENVVPTTVFTSGESRLFVCDFWNNTGSAMTLTVTATGGATVTIKYSQPIITI